MFGMGMPEIILILAIALIVLGPKKLPEIAKSLGRGIAEFKKATQDFKHSIDSDNDLKEAKKTIHDIKGDIQQTMRETMKPDVTTGPGSVDDEDDMDEDDPEEPETEEPAAGQEKAAPDTPAEKPSSLKADTEATGKGPSGNA